MTFPFQNIKQKQRSRFLTVWNIKNNCETEVKTNKKMFLIFFFPPPEKILMTSIKIWYFFFLNICDRFAFFRMNILFVVSDWTLGVHRCECIYTLVNPQCFDSNHTYIYGPKPYWHVNDSDLGNFHSPLPLQQTQPNWYRTWVACPLFFGSLHSTNTLTY